MTSFLNGKLNNKGRILYVLAAILLGISLYFPWWTMVLEAPQYRGDRALTLSVYAHKLDGNIDILNTLNRYIGMMQIDEASFPELQVIPWFVGALIFLSILTALVRRNSLALATFAAFCISGAIGFSRMLHWLHTFGTDLDPRAAFRIEPFVPPIIGTHQLANFTTFSNFGLGAYLLGVVALLMIVALWRCRQCDGKSSSSVFRSSS